MQSTDTPADAQSPVWEKRWFFWLVWGGFALLYLLNRSPYVGFHDGLTFLYTAAHGFDPATNATSHFLYNNLQHVILSVLSFLPHVLVLTLFSVGCSLGTLGFVYRIARLFTPSRGLALLPMVALGMSFTFWQQSEVIEVYAFNNLVFVSFLYVALRDIFRENRSNYLFVSVLLGIGTLTHIQHILSIPFFLGYLFWRNDLRFWQKALGMLPWMGLMGILFVLPAITELHTLKAVFFESKFQDELLGVDVRELAIGALMGLGMLVYNFHLGLWPVARGWRLLWKERKSLVMWLLLLGLPYLAFALKYSVDDNHVFYLCFYILLTLPLVHSLGQEPLVHKKWLGRMMVAGAVLPIVCYGSATLLATQVPALRDYDEAKAYKGGVVHLLWPGKAWARDPLMLAKQLYLQHPYPDEAEMPEWNYRHAIDYLFWADLGMEVAPVTDDMLVLPPPMPTSKPPLPPLPPDSSGEGW